MLQRRIAQVRAHAPVFYVSPLLEARGVRHAFSTRIGGVSPAPFDSLNLGNPSGCATQDDYARIYENYNLLQSAIGCTDEPRCWVHQVHGGEVVRVARNQPFQSGVKADAIVSDDPSRILSVRTADCVPVLMASDNGRFVAAVHAGWRGVIAGVAVNAAKLLSDCSSNQPIVAAIGPSIGFDAFEVGSEVLERFEQYFASRAPIRRRDDGKGYVDLREAIRIQLLDIGLAPEHIDTTDRCTFRDSGEFFSHRRDHGVTGRMAALIAARV